MRTPCIVLLSLLASAVSTPAIRAADAAPASDKAPAADSNTETDDNLAAAAKSLSAKLENDRPLLFIPKLTAPKALTGDLKDPVWTRSAKLKMVALDNGKLIPAALKTDVYLFCTAEALYVGVRCEDPDPAHCCVTNLAPWQNDSIEFFLYPGESCAGGKLYYQLCLDTEKNIEAAHTHMYPRHAWYRIALPWEPNVECEVAKSDKAWTMEFRLNYADLDLTPDAVAKNTLWRMHVVRNRPARGDLKVQNYAWMPTDPDRQNHLPWRWGYVLPESHATEKLIERVVERGKEVDDDPIPPEIGE